MKHRALAPLALGLAFAPALAAQEEGSSITFQAPGLESLEIGGQIRTRWENRDPATPIAGADSMSRGSARFRLYADATFTGGSGRVEFQKTIMSDGTPAADYLRQGYFILDDQFGMDVQMGRFAMKYGNQRMISDLDWSMVGRAWDGLRLSRGGDSYNVDLFWTQAVSGMAYAGPGEETFGGAYFTMDTEFVNFDVYALSRHNDAVVMLNDLTLGALLDGDLGPATWSFEFAAQSGDHGANDAGGTAFALRADMPVGDMWTTGLGYELASGADATGDGAFQPLYDFGHAYSGHQDLFRWSNLQDIVWRNKVTGVWDGWNLHGDLHLFAMDDAAGATPAKFAYIPTGDDDLGTEIDLYAKGKITEWLKLWAGVSFYSAGDAIMNGDDQSWIFFDFVVDF
jgi:hypothetical protein